MGNDGSKRSAFKCHFVNRYITVSVTVTFFLVKAVGKDMMDGGVSRY